MPAVVITEERLINAIRPSLSHSDGEPICVRGIQPLAWWQYFTFGFVFAGLVQKALVVAITNDRLLLLRHNLAFGKPEGKMAESVPLSSISNVSVREVGLPLYLKPAVRLSFAASGRSYHIDIFGEHYAFPQKHAQNRAKILERLQDRRGIESQ